MNFCKDCKYYVSRDKNPNFREDSEPLCQYPEFLHPVDGSVYLLCKDARNITIFCGRDGKKFEPMESDLLKKNKDENDL